MPEDSLHWLTEKECSVEVNPARIGPIGALSYICVATYNFGSSGIINPLTIITRGIGCTPTDALDEAKGAMQDALEAQRLYKNTIELSGKVWLAPEFNWDNRSAATPLLDMRNYFLRKRNETGEDARNDTLELSLTQIQGLVENSNPNDMGGRRIVLRAFNTRSMTLDMLLLNINKMMRDDGLPQIQAG